MSFARRVKYAAESELETAFFSKFEDIFGPNAILLNKTFIETEAEQTGTIPDGIAIDFKESTWFIIEVELISHGVWKHIAPQLVKILVALQNNDVKDRLSNIILDYLRSHPQKFKEIKSNVGIEDLEVFGKIQDILRTQPEIYIPIDSKKNTDFENLCKCFKYKTSIIEIEKIQDNTGQINYLPDKEITEITPQAGTEVVPTVSREGYKGFYIDLANQISKKYPYLPKLQTGSDEGYFRLPNGFLLVAGFRQRGFPIPQYGLYADIRFGRIGVFERDRDLNILAKNEIKDELEKTLRLKLDSRDWPEAKQKLAIWRNGDIGMNSKELQTLKDWTVENIEKFYLALQPIAQQFDWERLKMRLGEKSV